MFIIYSVYSFLLIKIIFHGNSVIIDSGAKIKGIPIIRKSRNGIIKIGKNFKMNSGKYYNLIGRQQPSMLISKGELIIGNNVGMSSTAIICQKRVVIGNNVKIGGGTVIYDTDFHSLNFNDRREWQKDEIYSRRKEVIIKDDVFIGAHSTILKGVIIGNKSIIGACSVVTKNIPNNEIWAGNPAKFISKI